MDSVFVGDVGQRISATVTLELRRLFSSDFGTKALCRFRDDAGNVMVWWSTSPVAFAMIIDEKYEITGTVKKHEVRDDIHQTELTRTKVISGKLKAEE